MKKMTVLCIVALIFCGCTTTINRYQIKNQKYPEWMLDHEFGRNYLGLQYGEHNKDRYEYDQNNFFIENMGIYGYRDVYLRLLINPQINYKYLNIIEISYLKDNEKIYLARNIQIKNIGRQYTELPEIKYKDFPKYFNNMEVGEKINITIVYIYQFDEDSIIMEEAPYTLSCFEKEYNPLAKFYPNF